MSDFFSQPERIYFVPIPIGKVKNIFLGIRVNLDLPLKGKEINIF
jgi:hypothetical protein